MDKTGFKGKNGDVFKSDLVAATFGSSYFDLEKMKEFRKEDYEAFTIDSSFVSRLNGLNGVNEEYNPLAHMDKCYLIPFFCRKRNISTNADSLLSFYSEIRFICTSVDFLNFMNAYTRTKNTFICGLRVMAQNFEDWSNDLDREVIKNGISMEERNDSIAYPERISIQEFVENNDSAIPKKILLRLKERVDFVNGEIENESLLMRDNDFVVVSLMFYGTYNKALAIAKFSDDDIEKIDDERVKNFSVVLKRIMDYYNTVDYLRIR